MPAMLGRLNLSAARLCHWMVASVVALAPSLVVAHHSFALFDQTKTLSAKGVIGRYEWTNPHVTVYIDLPGSSPQRVKLEAASVNALARQGWKPADLKVGDKAEATFHPLKSGDPGGLLIEIKTDSVVLKGGG